MSYRGDLPMYVIDAFSGSAFGGNPAAVCLEPAPQGLTADFAQKIAAEMNLAETAFIRKLTESDTFENACRFGLRWFTPTVEVVLCGHATLASAAALFHCVGNKSDVLYFETLSGTLEAKRGAESKISLNFPLDPPRPITVDDGFSDIIKLISATHVVDDVTYGTHNKFLLIRVKDGLDRRTFESWRVPAGEFHSSYTGDSLVGVMVTVRAPLPGDGHHGNHYDFLSRVFAPWAGIDEDSVTGAAHTILGAYWAKVLGKNSLYARQCSKRGGDLHLAVNNQDGRVEISGLATVVLRGTLSL